MIATSTLVALLAGPALPQDSLAPRPTAGSVSGRVLDALGEPVPLADVEFGVFDKPPLGKTKTDGTGMFAVSGLPLSATNYVVFSATAPGRTRQRSNVQVTPANPESTVVVRLWDAVALRGRALDAEGQPVVGAVVTAAYDELRSRTLDPSSETITDSEGRFVLERVPLGFITLQAWAPGYVMHTRRTWLRDAAELDFVMERGAQESLSVRVEGLPDGVTTVCSVVPWDSGSRRAWPRLLREVRGNQWQRSGWPPVCYRVSPRADGFRFDPPEQVTEGEGPNRLVFRAMPKNTDRLTVAGTLRDLEREPLARMPVTLRFDSGAEVAALTDAVGRFTIVADYPRGTRADLVLPSTCGYVLAQPLAEAAWDTGRTTFHGLRIGEENSVDLIAQPAATVRGRLLDAQGEPVAFQRIDLEAFGGHRDPRWTSCSRSVTTDRAGRFAFVGVRPPERDLRVVAGGPGNASASFQLGVGATHEFELTMRPLGSVGGVVRDLQGQPVPGARVWLYDCSEAGRGVDTLALEVLTDRMGHFRYVGVDPGRHLLWLQPATGPARTVGAAVTDRFEIEPGSHVERELSGDLGG